VDIRIATELSAPCVPTLERPFQKGFCRVQPLGISNCIVPFSAYFIEIALPGLQNCATLYQHVAASPVDLIGEPQPPIQQYRRVVGVRTDNHGAAPSIERVCEHPAQ